MARSGDSFGKKEKEKQRAKQKQEKAEKMQERKANAKKSRSLDDMMAYIDENGNISSTPPDPTKKKVFSAEDMQIGVPKQEEEDPIHTGVVTFFNDEKGFGFIQDMRTQERIFLHVKQLSKAVKEGDKLQYEVEQGPKGWNAINVRPL